MSFSPNFKRQFGCHHFKSRWKNCICDQLFDYFWAWHKVWHHGVWVLKILSTIFLNKKTKRSQITMENAHFTSLEVDECLPSFQDLKLVTAIFFCFEKMYVPINKQFRKFTIKYSKKNFVASFAPICRFIVRRVERYL